jgi:hypothetical protein
MRTLRLRQRHVESRIVLDQRLPDRGIQRGTKRGVDAVHRRRSQRVAGQ